MTQTLLMRRLIATILATMICGGFANSQVVVKIHNKTGENFKQFSANLNGREYSFQDFKTWQTRKIQVDSTYPYFYMIAVTAKDSVRFQPSDFVGEPLYKDGKIILTLTIFEREGKRYLNKRTRRVGSSGVVPNHLY